MWLLKFMFRKLFQKICWSHWEKLWNWHWKFGTESEFILDCFYVQSVFRHESSQSVVLQPDIRRAVSSRVSQLVGERRTVWLFTKIHQEVFVHGETAVNRVHIDLHHHRTLSENTDIFTHCCSTSMNLTQSTFTFIWPLTDPLIMLKLRYFQFSILFCSHSSYIH